MELGKNSILFQEKIYLYGWAGTPIFEELWLMCNADAHCTLGREEAQADTQKEFYV